MPKESPAETAAAAAADFAVGPTLMSSFSSGRRGFTGTLGHFPLTATQQADHPTSHLLRQGWEETPHWTSTPQISITRAPPKAGGIEG